MIKYMNIVGAKARSAFEKKVNTVIKNKVLSKYAELLGKELDKDEIIRATLDMESAVETHPNHRILYYEDMVNFLSRREDERF